MGSRGVVVLMRGGFFSRENKTRKCGNCVCVRRSEEEETQFQTGLLLIPDTVQLIFPKRCLEFLPTIFHLLISFSFFVDVQ